MTFKETSTMVAAPHGALVLDGDGKQYKKIMSPISVFYLPWPRDVTGEIIKEILSEK